MYHREFGEEDTKLSEDAAAEGPVNSKSLGFWHKLIALMVSIVEEDSNVYAGVLCQ